MQDLIKFGLVPAAGLALPLAVFAGAPTANQGISYNYLEASYVFGNDIDIDDGDVGFDAPEIDIDGFFFKGSAEVSPGIFVYASNLTLDLRIDETSGPGIKDFDLGVDNQSLGVGYHMPLMPGPAPLDVYASLSYERLDTVGQPANGYGITGGARWMPIQGLEINAFTGWRDFGDVGGLVDASGVDVDIDGWIFGVGAVYNVTPKLALTADWTRYALNADIDAGGGGDANIDFDVEAFMVGGRFYY